MAITINLKELFADDPQEIFSDKLNYNFNKLLELGVGQKGKQGDQGKTGPALPGARGQQGPRGSLIYTGSGDPDAAIDPSLVELLDLDTYWDSTNVKYYQYDLEDGESPSTGSWNQVFDLRQDIIDYISELSSVAFTRTGDLALGSPSDTRFVTFLENPSESDDSDNLALFLKNFTIETSDSGSTDYLLNYNTETDNNFLHTGVEVIYTDFRLNTDLDEFKNVRSQLSLGSAYLDTVAGTPGNYLTTIDQNLKVRHEMWLNGGSTAYIPVGKFSTSVLSEIGAAATGINNDSGFLFESGDLSGTKNVYLGVGSKTALNTILDESSINTHGIGINYNTNKYIGFGIDSSDSSKSRLEFFNTDFYISDESQDVLTFTYSDTRIKSDYNLYMNGVVTIGGIDIDTDYLLLVDGDSVGVDKDIRLLSGGSSSVSAEFTMYGGGTNNNAIHMFSGTNLDGDGGQIRIFGSDGSTAGGIGGDVFIGGGDGFDSGSASDGGSVYIYSGGGNGAGGGSGSIGIGTSSPASGDLGDIVLKTGGVSFNFTSTDGDIILDADNDVNISADNDIYLDATGNDIYVDCDILDIDVSTRVDITGDVQINSVVAIGDTAANASSANQKLRIIGDETDKNIYIKGGDVTGSSDAGDIEIIAGNAVNGTAGSITLASGSESGTGTRGSITIDSDNILDIKSRSTLDVTAEGIVNQINLRAFKTVFKDSSGNERLAIIPDTGPVLGALISNEDYGDRPLTVSTNGDMGLYTTGDGKDVNIYTSDDSPSFCGDINISAGSSDSTAIAAGNINLTPGKAGTGNTYINNGTVKLEQSGRFNYFVENQTLSLSVPTSTDEAIVLGLTNVPKADLEENVSYDRTAILCYHNNTADTRTVEFYIDPTGAGSGTLVYNAYIGPGQYSNITIPVPGTYQLRHKASASGVTLVSASVFKLGEGYDHDLT